MSEPLTIIGSVLMGAAQGWSQGKAEKDRRDAEEKDQKRKTDSYRGLGESVRYWEDENGQPKQTRTEEIASAPALGNNSNQVGQKYIDRAERNKTQGPRYQFDRKSGRINYG